MENITKGELQKKLQYLNLDLDNVPSEIVDYQPLNFNVSRLNNDKDHRIFRFVPIDKIDILISPCLRTDPLKEKYANALPLFKYIFPAKKEEDIERYTTFLKMLEAVTVPEIENVASIQKELEKKEPFKVVYPKDNMWQIYYSESVGRYFMIVCSKEKTFAEFFYLLKAKIDYIENGGKTVPRVYVPINAMNYCEEFLNRTEIADLENYLWLFTKNWAMSFEVYSKTNALSLQITGETVVYDNVKSSYKIKLTNREEALKFYKLLKALFIMQTEIKNRFEFTTKIDSNNGLELYIGETRLTYEMLTEFIKEQFKVAEVEIKEQNEKIREIEEELANIKFAVKAKEDEYLIKQREISTYLEYKKTFIGKMKYFFKSTKINKQIVNDTQSARRKRRSEEENEPIVSQAVNTAPLQTSLKNKKFYTIEDLVTVYTLLEKGVKSYKNLNQDLKAQRLKLENIISKVKNANLYIEEIDKHKKSIFDFWKFSNKDEKLSLEMGDEFDKDDSKKSLKRAFDLETDLEELGAKVDTLQRKKLSREELDSVFVANTEVLPLLNMLRENDLNKKALEDCLLSLKDEFNENKMLIEEETFDIFGNVADDNTKVKYIGSRSHRENNRSKFKILNVNKKIDVFDFTEKLQSIITFIEGAIPKARSEFDFSLYKVCQITETIKDNAFEVYNLDVEKALSEYEDDGEGALNLIKINYKEDLPLLYYSNIMFYDNTNQTLPVGMDESTSVLIDTKRLQFNLVSKDKFRTNNYFTESNNLILPKTKDVFVYEYDVELKKQDVKVDEEQVEQAEEYSELENVIDSLENLDEE